MTPSLVDVEDQTDTRSAGAIDFDVAGDRARDAQAEAATNTLRTIDEPATVAHVDFEFRIIVDSRIDFHGTRCAFDVGVLDCVRKDFADCREDVVNRIRSKLESFEERTQCVTHRPNVCT